MINKQKESIKKDVSNHVIDGAEMNLNKENDKKAHDKAIQDM